MSMQLASSSSGIAAACLLSYAPCDSLRESWSLLIVVMEFTDFEWLEWRLPASARKLRNHWGKESKQVLVLWGGGALPFEIFLDLVGTRRKSWVLTRYTLQGNKVCPKYTGVEIRGIMLISWNLKTRCQVAKLDTYLQRTIECIQIWKHRIHDNLLAWCHFSSLQKHWNCLKNKIDFGLLPSQGAAYKTWKIASTPCYFSIILLFHSHMLLPALDERSP
jgi:hypothetical protein